MFVTADDETLIEMRTMTIEKFFTPEQALKERDACIHDECPHEEGAKHESIAALVGREQGQDSEGITKKRTGDVAHEDFGGRPVVTEKTQAAGGNGQRDPKHKVVMHVRCQHHPTERTGQGYTTRDSVDAVHKVVGVGQTDDPQKSDDNSDY